jgi:hypothetical protein
MKCAFDLLNKRFKILVIHVWSYSQRTLDLIMHDYIILHNMISTTRETSTKMITITLSLPSLLHLSPTRHRLVSQPFFKERHI